MKKQNCVSLIIIVILLFSCSTKMKIKGTTLNSLQPLKNSQSVVIVEENETIDDNNGKIKLGEFQINDGGISNDCSYDKVKDIAKNKARSIGGNSVKIIEHKLPSAWSNCHRIKFEVYKLDNITKYEKELIWSSANKLKWEHFRAAPKIARSSYFCGYINVKFNDQNFLNGKGEVNVSPIYLFDCSYVQPLKKVKYLLEYNQVKFDLLEIYARKMRDEFSKSEINTQEKWTKFAQSTFDKVNSEYETDFFNLETETNYGENYTELIKWQYKTENGLKELIELSSDKY